MVVPQEEAQFDAPLTVPPDWLACVQVNVVPLTVEFNSILVVEPVQMDSALAEPTGVGFTNTVAVIGDPTQNVGAGPVGVMVKVTVTGALVVFVNVPVMLPLPLAAIPVTSVVLSRVQAKVVPVTELLVPKLIVPIATPEHLV